MKTLRNGGKQQSPEQFAAKPILSLFAREQSALWHSARLLGGYEAARLVDRCAAILERDGAITRQARLMLEQILSILSLEEAHDPDKPFMAFFAVIDPEDPVVEEICLLTDKLRTALAESVKRQRWMEGRNTSPVPV